MMLCLDMSKHAIRPRSGIGSGVNFNRTELGRVLSVRGKHCITNMLSPLYGLLKSTESASNWLVSLVATPSFDLGHISLERESDL